ncbi:MAG: haloacid dehalogenase type II [Rubrobacter sp.]|nr:haloacid dehalogenase type II [Rubrobacteraceae bacterium]MBA3793259.1 haloacid dehalogenase type II [Rubrobacter sp.]MDQ3316424.1 haloacid dehalogenase type II [Actinomycetota bacterium]MDQ3428324.1 haloacid dehalogenase type II [Actinomycetota bacterium]
MPRVIVFDVNETLLDLGALDPRFERVFGDGSIRREWFQQLLQSALVATVTGSYSDFGTIGGAALRMTAARHGMELSDEDQGYILAGMRELPPHPEAPAALDRLRDAGIRLAALTNSTEEVANAQLSNAGLADRFERILSADTVKRLKPAPEPYRAAAESLGVEMGEVRLVAAHAWDVAGAMRAGCAAAFVARPGMVLDPLVQTPDVVGADLDEVASLIIAAGS